MNYTQEQINQKFNSLPSDIKEAIESVEMGKLVAEIGEKNDLMLDQTAELMDATALVMLGLIKTREFNRYLSDTLNIDLKKANLIAADINDKIFNKIRESLQKIQSEENSSEPESTPSQPTPSQTPPPTSQPSNSIIHLNPHQPTSTPSQPTAHTNIPTNTQKDPNISAIERVGGFTVEKHDAPTSSYLNNVPHPSKETVLKKIEDQTPKPSLSAAMVDHLLTSHVDNPERKEEIAPTPVTQTPPAQPTTPPLTPTKPTEPQATSEKKSYTTDPYREPI